MTSSHVLVTGCQGYIGTVLVPHLISRGFNVLGVDSGLFAACTLGACPEPFPILHRDIRDLRIGDFDGVQMVVHLAALSNDPLGNLDASLTYDINHHATAHVAKLSREAGVERFVFSSSCSTYGKAGDEFLDEGAEFNPVTPYGESKVFAERELSRLADDTFSPVFLRNATAYGYSPRLRLDLVVNDFVASAMCNGRIEIRSDGTPWRPLVHVKDICCGIVAALSAPREAIHNRAFNIGRTDENYRVRELADIVQAEIPGCTVEYASGGMPDARCYRVNCDLAQRELPGFRPEWNVSQGIAHLFASLKNSGFTVADIASQRFIRLARIRELQAMGQIGSDLRRSTTEVRSSPV
ncbi:MAG: SDR family oxidoreductase [Planctomycetota bacterium]|nr:SDR family oxidoreductase [Planctomycetota bacterium]